MQTPIEFTPTLASYAFTLEADGSARENGQPEVSRIQTIYITQTAPISLFQDNVQAILSGVVSFTTNTTSDEALHDKLTQQLLQPYYYSNTLQKLVDTTEISKAKYVGSLTGYNQLNSNWVVKFARGVLPSLLTGSSITTMLERKNQIEVTSAGCFSLFLKSNDGNTYPFVWADIINKSNSPYKALIVIAKRLAKDALETQTLLKDFKQLSLGLYGGYNNRAIFAAIVIRSSQTSPPVLTQAAEHTVLSQFMTESAKREIIAKRLTTMTESRPGALCTAVISYKSPRKD